MDRRVRRALGAAEVPLHRGHRREDRAAADQSDRRRSRRQRAADCSTRSRAGAARGADLAVTPELALVGYLPRDLLLSAGFVRRSWERARRARARRSPALPPVLVGLPEPNPSDEGRPLFNTRRAPARRRDRASGSARRCCRPTTSSTRTATSSRFTARRSSSSAARRLGISICEDIWNDRDFWKRRRYHHDPIEELVRAGARRDRQPVGVAVRGRQAPAARGDARQHGAQAPRAARCTSTSSAATTTSCSTAAAARSTPTARRSPAAASFDADVVVCDLDARTPIAPPADVDVESEIWRALVLGTRDYARKCGFSRAVLGLSGGIDSALTAAIAVEALGAGPRARRADAVALLEPRQHRRRAGARARTSASRR